MKVYIQVNGVNVIWEWEITRKVYTVPYVSWSRVLSIFFLILSRKSNYQN